MIKRNRFNQEMKKAGIVRKQSLMKNFIMRNELFSDDHKYKIRKNCPKDNSTK